MSEKMTVRVTVDGKEYCVPAGTIISVLTEGELPCGGHGKCGKCRVYADGILSETSAAEREALSQAEIDDGIRLACCTAVLGEAVVRRFHDDEADAVRQIVTDGAIPSFPCDPIFSCYGAAVDIGTTTLAARLYDRGGRILASASALNPQSVCGADVISRVEAACRGEAERLQRLVADSVGKLLAELAVISGIPLDAIDAVVCTGNTVMLHLLTHTSVEPFSHAPFAVGRLFDEQICAGELGIEGLRVDTMIYLPPCISAFVGADTVCALLAAGVCDDMRTALLVDIGTNGELALCHDGHLYVCSTAAGPALEGVGISMGMCGERGAIDRVTVVNGQMHAHTIGDVHPIGVCGSGLVDAVACLLLLEELDETGYLEDDPARIAGGVSVSARDIRMVQLAKGAISAGIHTMLITAGLSPRDLDVLYVAGGFGSYLNLESAARIGLLPAKDVKRTEVIGNAALGGASMLLLQRSFRETCCSLAAKAVVVELASNPIFTREYMERMTF